MLGHTNMDIASGYPLTRIDNGENIYEVSRHSISCESYCLNIRKHTSLCFVSQCVDRPIYRHTEPSRIIATLSEYEQNRL